MKATLSLMLAAIVLLSACQTTTDGTAAGGDTAQAAGGTPQPAGLTRDEITIWNSLSEAAKAQAAEFIANGGTLTQFVAI